MSTSPDGPKTPGDLQTLFATVYAAQSAPVTIIDCQGLILDVNQAFLDYAGTIHPEKPPDKADRVGKPLLSFTRNEQARTELEDFVQQLIGQQTADFLQHKTIHPTTGEPLYVEIEGIPLPDASGEIVAIALIRRDLTDIRRARLQRERRRQALQTVRDSIWQMRSVDDNYLLIKAIYTTLPQADMPLTDCSINAVDTNGLQPTVRFYDVSARRWEKGTEDKGSDIVLNIWRNGEPAYRRDLQEHDTYHERDHIQAISKAPIRSVVDIPFSQGTLAVSSIQPNAFTESDIAFLQDMAGVIDEGFSRLKDLENLAEQARTAEALAGAIAAVTDSRDLDEVLQKVVEGTAQVLSSHRVCCYLWDEEQQALVPRAQVGQDWESTRKIRLRPGESLSGKVFASGEPQYLDDSDLEAYLQQLGAENRAAFIKAIGNGNLYPAIAIPLLLEDKVIGTLSVAEGTHAYTQRDIDLLQRLGEQAVLAIDRTQREAELKASEARYRTLFEQSPEAVAVHAEGKYLFANQAAANTLGAESPDQLVGRTIIDHIHPDYHHLIQQRLANLLSGQAVQTTELKLMRHDGRIIDAQSSASAVTYHGQHAVQSIFSDITGRKLAEERLKLDLAIQQVRNEVLQMQSEAEWGKVAVRCHEGLVQFVSFEQCGFTLLNLESDTYDSFPIDDDGLVAKHTFDNIPSSLRQAVESGEPVYRRTREELRRHGDNIGTETSCILDVPFRGGTLAINSVRENAFTERDIQILGQFAQVMSEAYRRLEDLQQLARQEETLAQSQKLEAVGQLAGGIAHDFNNMLTAILTACEFMLIDRGIGHPENQDLNLIKQAGEQAAMLTRQLLAFSRRQYLQPVVVDLNRIIGETQQMLSRLIGEHITQQTSLDTDASWVRVDPGQIEQVLFNLAINARDAMPHGGRLSIETANVELTETSGDIPPGEYVTLRISDTGIGMDDETLARIFEPFFTTKELGRGTGMGLATVYGVVQQSGGHIQVRSTPEAGTTFEIHLPQAAETDTSAARTAVPRNEIPMGTETILLVEDEDMVRTVASAALIRCGYRVLEAEDGLDALRVHAEHRGPLDMVLTDVVMPGMGGEALAEALLAEQPNLQVLFMSGYLREARLRDRPFLPKPFTPETLSRKVRQVLDA